MRNLVSYKGRKKKTWWKKSDKMWCFFKQNFKKNNDKKRQIPDDVFKKIKVFPLEVLIKQMYLRLQLIFLGTGLKNSKIIVHFDETAHIEVKKNCLWRLSHVVKLVGLWPKKCNEK